MEIFDQREKIQPELLDGSGRFIEAYSKGYLNISSGNPYLLLGTKKGGYYDSPPMGDL